MTSGPQTSQSGDSATDDLVERMARSFHSHYERLAPEFMYVTRSVSAVAWEDVPEANRLLMITTCRHVLTEMLTDWFPNLRAAAGERQ